MAAPTGGIARRLPVGRLLSESFAVSGNRKHTLAVRHRAKFRGVFSAFWLQTLFLRQTSAAIRQTFGSIECFLGDDRRHDRVGLV
jgi:hypothetical protein